LVEIGHPPCTTAVNVFSGIVLGADSQLLPSAVGVRIGEKFSRPAARSVFVSLKGEPMLRAALV
jgi:hypothetical protein